MSALDGFIKALQPIVGGAGIVAGATGLGGPASPLLLAGGLSTLGQSIQAFDTKTVPNGATDEQILRSEQAARRAGNQRIEGRRRRAQQGLASSAAQGGTLGSGLYAGDAARVDSGADQAGADLDASLSQNRIAQLNARTYRPETGALGMFGRLMSSTAMPLTYLGARQLAGAGAPQVQPGFGGVGGGYMGSPTADQFTPLDIRQPAQRPAPVRPAFNKDPWDTRR